MSANESASDDDTEFVDRVKQLNDKDDANEIGLVIDSFADLVIDAMDSAMDPLADFNDKAIGIVEEAQCPQCAPVGDDALPPPATLARKKSADRCQKCDHRATVTAMKMFGDDRTYRKVTCRDDECGHVHLEEESDSDE